MKEIQKIMPDAKLELVTMKTTGDKILHQTLDKIGGKGLFLKELDAALLSGKVDLCIHSLKDVPTEENAAIPLGAYSIRETPGDVLVLPKGVFHWNPAQPVGYGALILAEAGLKRLNLSDRISVRFSPEQMVPAAGQGVIVTQSRAGEYSELLKQLNHPDVALCVKIERRLSALLEGDCSAPIGCHARLCGNHMTLYGFSGLGGVPKHALVQGEKTNAAALAEALARQLQE